MGNDIVTLQQIADKVGVSKMTVSNALRGRPNASAALKAKISAVAEEMGYMRNPAVSQLMSYLSGRRRSSAFQGTIALINPSRNRDLMKQEVALRQFETGAHTRAQELGYRIEKFWYYEPKTTPRRLAAILKARGIEGIVLSSAGEAETIFEFDHASFSFVTVGDTIVEPKVNRVMEYHFNNCVFLLERLRKLQYRKVGFAFSARLQQIHAMRHKAAALSYYSGIRPAERCPIFEYGAWDHERFIRWYRRNKPEVVVSNDSDAYESLLAEGYKIPSEVGFAHLSLLVAGKVSGIRLHFGLLGRTAVDILVGQLHRREIGVPAVPQIVKVEGAWHLGETVRRPGR